MVNNCDGGSTHPYGLHDQDDPLSLRTVCYHTDSGRSLNKVNKRDSVIPFSGGDAPIMRTEKEQL